MSNYRHSRWIKSDQQHLDDDIAFRILFGLLKSMLKENNNNIQKHHHRCLIKRVLI